MSNAREGSVRLFRFAGIDLFLHWSWFLVAALEISSRSRRYSSLTWNALEYLALFLIVMLHEFGHALACRQVGGKADQIVLWPLGGVAYVDPPPRPGATLWSIAAGPLVNVVLVLVLSALGVLGRSSGWSAAEPNAHALLRAIWFINLILLIFNMLPIYPLDGGQILRSLLWFVLGRARSLMAVTVIGFLGVAGLMIFAWRIHSLWTGIIAAYMLFSCWKGLQHARLLSRFESAPTQAGGLVEKYTEATDPKLQARARISHESESAPLQALGFCHLAYCLEVLGPYSAILQFPLLLMMWRKNRALAFPSPFRIAVASVLLVHSRPDTIAACVGLGVKFYTGFSDGSLLISPTFQSRLLPRPGSSIIKTAPGGTVEETWLAHQQRIAEMEAQGKMVRNSRSFSDYVEMSRLEENLSQYFQPGDGAPAPEPA
ncbi:MAG: M50 family metallopeptidase [Terriglobales bacterium]